MVDQDKDCLTIYLTPHAMRIMSNKGLSSFDLHPSPPYAASVFFSELALPKAIAPLLRTGMLLWTSSSELYMI